MLGLRERHLIVNFDRAALLSRTDLQGLEFCHALAAQTDSWIQELFDAAMEKVPVSGRVALLAVGGYGRGELAPFSDLDLLLVHDGARPIEDFASNLWYPIWDAGLKLGHSVRTVAETMKLASDDLDTATGILTARFLAGEKSLAEEVAKGASTNWLNPKKGWLRQLHARVLERQQKAGEVAFLLEPELKEGMGGLRDIHAIGWALSAGLVLSAEDTISLARHNETLTRARVALHQVTNRASDVLRLEDQDAVATHLGYKDADALMAEIAAAGRSVMWITDEAWALLDPPKARGVQPIAPGVELVDGFVQLTEDANPAEDPTLLLRVATSAARHGARISRSTLAKLADETQPWPDPWPAGASDDLVALLLEGRAAIPVFEALDHHDLITRVLPEWSPVRSRPQRNAYHRFTVDRHLWEAVANAMELRDSVSRPDLLALGAMFHDIGKGYPGDHTDVGVAMFKVIGHRMGLTDEDTDTVILLIRNHLLLADVATRRDLSDDATITGVAKELTTAGNVDLLRALTIADSLATGPSAWGTWKAGLVDELARRVKHFLGGGDITDVLWRLFPDAEVLEMMASGQVVARTTDDSITVVNPNAVGVLSSVAGVLSLAGLDVLGADVHADEQGMAASKFRVAIPSYGPVDWEPIVNNIYKAMDKKFALQARIAERERTYTRPRRRTAVVPAAPTVRFDDSASSRSTFIEVRATDRVGILFRITEAMVDLGLDIRHARVQTIGDEAVDTFYVRNRDGSLVTDIDHRKEIQRAILHAVTRAD